MAKRTSQDDQLEREIAGLYEGPLEQFIADRNALEGRLRSAGETGSAHRVKQLRKPSLAAWAINQLARRRSGEIDDLMAMGKRLREAQRGAMAGGGGAKLQEAAAERRRVVEGLLEAARAVLEEEGHPAARSQLDHVENTLLATATDDALSERVRRGTLEKEAPPPADFGGLASIEGAPLGRPASKKAGGRPSKQATPGSKAARAARASPEDRRLERARRRAEELDSAAREAEAEARTLRKEADEAASRAKRAAASAQRADARAKEARTRATRAVREAAPR